MENNKNLVLDVNENPKKLSHWLLFAFQHILAMLVACITVPLITGMPIAATLIAAGIGTICYLLFTKQKSPVFLSSSFAYLAPMSSALAVGLVNNAAGQNYLGLILGMAMVGLVYVLVALIIKLVGTNWINKLLPPVVVGPIIMVIGLGLAGSAVSNLTKASASGQSYNLLALFCGLIALIVTALASHYGEGKTISLIPFVCGMGAGYISAVLITLIGYTWLGNTACNIVNFTPLTSLFTKENIGLSSFFNYNLFVPNHEESFIILRFEEISKFNWAEIGTIALLFIPVAFVTICEHIGDHKNLGNIINKDLLNEEPGMTRTLLGDGIATAISGAMCGAANTTYGENVAVIGTTKIASVKVVLLAALMTVIIGFVTPFTALLSTIPSCVTGGVSLILYGFIASSGVKMLIQEKVNFSSSRTIFITSVILVAGIGGLTLQLFPQFTTNLVTEYTTLENFLTIKDTLVNVNATEFVNLTEGVIVKYTHEVTTLAKYSLTITSIAIAMFLGIFLNAILKEKKEN